MEYLAWNRILELKTVNDQDRLTMLKAFENYTK
jgi:hypothetical protein